MWRLAYAWRFALEAHVDFLAVLEHRLIPARVRGKWTRLKCKGQASIWARSVYAFGGAVNLLGCRF